MYNTDLSEYAGIHVPHSSILGQIVDNNALWIWGKLKVHIRTCEVLYSVVSNDALSISTFNPS